ncbi:MAG: hypothetical protein JO021_00430 [Alphaproteobacteria bacterium]|nr:hypothetical protein [Alphaproteobacteria bacterium]
MVGGRQTYRCFFKTAEGRFAGVYEISAVTEAEARDKCLVLLRAGSHPTVELWLLDRFVASLTQ